MTSAFGLMGLNLRGTMQQQALFVNIFCPRVIRGRVGIRHNQMNVNS